MNKAIVAKIDRVQEIPGADKIQTAYVLGQQVVVSKDWNEGMVGIFFQPDLQLSELFCFYNNLYRHSEKNHNKEAKGFFADNRRVRCQPFMKVKSEGFFTTLESLKFTNIDIDSLKVGDQFDELDGYEICKKYISEKTRKAMNNVQKKKTKVIDTPLFHKHCDTEQFRYYVGAIPEGALLSFHAKVHGTSGRYAYTKVIREPKTWKEKILDFFGKFEREKWDYVVGTRNVTLYSDQYDKEGFHGSEQFRFDVLEMLKPYLEKGMTIYGELAGYANGKPIMGKHSTAALKDKKFKKKYGDEVVYKYGCIEGDMRFHVYRITYVNEEGNELDFTNEQVISWCENRGLNPPLEIYPSYVYDGQQETLIKIVDQLTERPSLMTEDYIDPSHPSEGIVIRVDYDTQVPKFYKSKSYVFKVMEGIFKEDNVDVEDAA